MPPWLDVGSEASVLVTVNETFEVAPGARPAYDAVAGEAEKPAGSSSLTLPDCVAVA